MVKGSFQKFRLFSLQGFFSMTTTVGSGARSGRAFSELAEPVLVFTHLRFSCGLCHLSGLACLTFWLLISLPCHTVSCRAHGTRIKTIIMQQRLSCTASTFTSIKGKWKVSEWHFD